MKKLLTLLMVLLVLAGCTTKQDEPVEPKTMGEAYAQAFKNSESTDPNAIVDELMALELFEGVLVKNEVEPGWLMGVTVDVENFATGVSFGPMISTIPFIGYVLKSDDAEALAKVLDENADLRWNICTEADEKQVVVKGDLVLFLMCRNSEQ